MGYKLDPKERSDEFVSKAYDLYLKKLYKGKESIKSVKVSVKEIPGAKSVEELIAEGYIDTKDFDQGVSPYPIGSEERMPIPYVGLIGNGTEEDLPDLGLIGRGSEDIKERVSSPKNNIQNFSKTPQKVKVSPIIMFDIDPNSYTPIFLDTAGSYSEYRNKIDALLVNNLALKIPSIYKKPWIKLFNSTVSLDGSDLNIFLEDLDDRFGSFFRADNGGRWGTGSSFNSSMAISEIVESYYLTSKEYPEILRSDRKANCIFLIVGNEPERELKRAIRILESILSEDRYNIVNRKGFGANVFNPEDQGSNFYISTDLIKDIKEIYIYKLVDEDTPAVEKEGRTDFLYWKIKEISIHEMVDMEFPEYVSVNESINDYSETSNLLITQSIKSI